ncbi:TolC family protein, partial [bacterium]
TGQISIDKCLNLGLKHYLPLNIAEKEIDNTQLKKEKSMRDFFPNISVLYTKADGEIENGGNIPGFKEVRYGVQVSQTLYEAGRIRKKYRYNSLNHIISKLKLKVLEKFLKYSIQEAYYDVLEEYLRKKSI